MDRVTITNRTHKRAGNGDWVLPAGIEATAVTKDNGIWVKFPVGDDGTVDFALREVLRDRDGFTVEASNGSLHRLLADVGVEGGIVYAPRLRIDIVGISGMGRTRLALLLVKWLRENVKPVEYITYTRVEEVPLLDYRGHAAVVIDKAGGGTSTAPTILPAAVTVLVSQRPLHTIKQADRIIAFQCKAVDSLPIFLPQAVTMLPPNKFLVFDLDEGEERGRRTGRSRRCSRSSITVTIPDCRRWW
jgi:hypothetical protein